MQNVHAPRRWERGNFHLTAVHSHIDPDRTISTVFPLAQVNNLISTTPGQEQWGMQLAQMTRRLEIGGIKFTAHQYLVGFANAFEIEAANVAESTTTQIDTKVLICSDRIGVPDQASGIAFPTAIEADFFTSTLPTARVASGNDIEPNYPTQIHWQNHIRLNGGFHYAVDESVGDPGPIAAFLPQQQTVVSSRSTSNLRLRLRLQDDEALGVWFTSQPEFSATLTNLEPEVAFVFSGTIWYRFVT